MSGDLSEVTQRGEQYLETARTLLRTAKTMTDRAIAGQLKALAEDYQRRAEQLHVSMRPNLERFEMPAIALEDWRGKP